MKRAKILLLDFNPASGLGGTLREILESSSCSEPGRTMCPGVLLRYESIGVCGPDLSDSDISSMISSFKPNVIFLVWSSNLVNQASALFQFMKRERLALPVLVVIREGEPDEIFELLRLGVADFIAPPLEAMNILPRIWRLLEQTGHGETSGQKLKEKLGVKQLVGESPLFLAQIKKFRC